METGSNGQMTAMENKSKQSLLFVNSIVISQLFHVSTLYIIILACVELCSGLNNNRGARLHPTPPVKVGGDHLTLESLIDIELSTDGLVDIDSSLKPLMTTPSQPILTSCNAFIVDFSDAAAAYTRCSILHARPLRFCEHCVHEYLAAQVSYNMIMKGTAYDEDGKLCSDIILNSDRIHIVEQTNTFIKGLWENCYCEKCFIGVDLNTTMADLSNDTMMFLEKANRTDACFLNHTHGADVQPFTWTNKTIDPMICDDCREHYNDLNHFYEHLLEVYKEEVCMDIVDIMNSTRLLWSKEFLCTHHMLDVVPIILLTVFFCALPVLFYTANKIHGTKAEKKVLKQKRLRESQIHNSIREEET